VEFRHIALKLFRSQLRKRLVTLLLVSSVYADLTPLA